MHYIRIVFITHIRHNCNIIYYFAYKRTFLMFNMNFDYMHSGNSFVDLVDLHSSLFIRNQRLFTWINYVV